MKNILVKLLAVFIAFFMPAIVFGQADPVGDITGAAGTAGDAFDAFVAITVTAFIVGIVIKYARKAVK